MTTPNTNPIVVIDSANVRAEFPTEAAAVEYCKQLCLTTMRRNLEYMLYEPIEWDGRRALKLVGSVIKAKGVVKTTGRPLANIIIMEPRRLAAELRGDTQ